MSFSSISIENLNAGTDSPAAARTAIFEAVSRVAASGRLYLTGSDTLESARTSIDVAGKTVVVTSALTEAQSNILGPWPTDRALKIEKSGIINNSTAFTINGTFSASANLVFNGSGVIRFGVSSVLAVLPEWWGDGNGTIRKAIEALPDSGGVVSLRPVDYDMINVWTRYDGNEKPNVKLIGSGMPVVAADGARFITGSGTVIQGMVLNFADGFESYDLGVDCGAYVIGLSEQPFLECFVPGTHKLVHGADELQYYIKDVSFDNIRALSWSDVANTAHTILCEHINGLTFGKCEALGGFHGFVCKSINVKGGNVITYGALNDSYIFKSDAYTLCRNVTIDSISMGRAEHPIVSAPGMFVSLDGKSTAGVTVGTLHGINCKTLIKDGGSSDLIVNTAFGTVFGDGITGSGIELNAKFVRANIGQHIISVPSEHGIVTVDGCVQINIGSGVVNNAGGNGYVLAGDVKSGIIAPRANTGFGVVLVSNLDINNISDDTLSPNGSGLISTYNTLLDNSALINGWINTAAWPFQVILVGRTVHVRGTITAGTAGDVTTLPVGIRPSATLSFVTLAVKDGVRVFAHVDILPTGVLNVANFADLGVTKDIGFNFSYLL